MFLFDANMNLAAVDLRPMQHKTVCFAPACAVINCAAAVSKVRRLGRLLST